MNSIPLDPDIFTWCNGERVERFKTVFINAHKFMAWSGFLAKEIQAWIKFEILSEQLGLQQALNVTETSSVASEALIGWARGHWEHRLETLYLNEKHNLDVVTCSLLRVKDQYLAFELYHRLKAGEEKFSELSWRYGEGNEKSNGGRFLKQRYDQLPSGLHPLLRKLKPGEVLKPHRMGEWYVLLTLDELIPAQLDETTQTLLLNRELRQWALAVQEYLTAQLELGH